MLTGQDINDPKDLPSITAALKAMKPNVKLMWSSEDEWNKTFATDALRHRAATIGSGGGAFGQTAQASVDFVVPRKARSAGSTAQLATSCFEHEERRRPAVHQLHDRSQILYGMGESAGAPASAISVTISQLPAATTLNRQIYKTEYLTKLQFMSALPDDRRQAFNDIWDEVKAFYAK